MKMKLQIYAQVALPLIPLSEGWLAAQEAQLLLQATNSKGQVAGGQDQQEDPNRQTDRQSDKSLTLQCTVIQLLVGITGSFLPLKIIILVHDQQVAAGKVNSGLYIFPHQDSEIQTSVFT